MPEPESLTAQYYLRLRREGHLYLNFDERWVISSLRDYAKRQGLRVSQRTTRGSAITDIWLLSGDRTEYVIVAPDREQS